MRSNFLAATRIPPPRAYLPTVWLASCRMRLNCFFMVAPLAEKRSAEFKREGGRGRGNRRLSRGGGAEEGGYMALLLQGGGRRRRGRRSLELQRGRGRGAPPSQQQHRSLLHPPGAQLLRLRLPEAQQQPPPSEPARPRRIRASRRPSLGQPCSALVPSP